MKIEPKSISNRSIRSYDVSSQYLKSKNIDTEEGGRVNFDNSTLSTNNTNVSFTGGSVTLSTLQVANASAFNGPISLNDDVTVSSSSIFTVNSQPIFNNGILCNTGTFTFNNGMIVSGTATFQDPVNLYDNFSIINGVVTLTNTPLNSNSNINITGTITATGGIITTNITGTSITVTTANATNINATTIIANGITVGDPNNVGIFSGGVIQAATGSTTFTIKESTAHGGNNSLLYTSATGSTINETGLSIYDNSSNRKFYIDNINGNIALENPIRIRSTYLGTGDGGINISHSSNITNESLGGDSVIIGTNITTPYLINSVIEGSDITITGTSSVFNNIIGRNININNNDGCNIIGNTNNIYSTLIDSTHNVIGDSNNITGSGFINIIGRANNINNISNLYVAGSTNTINSATGIQQNSKAVVLGYDNNVSLTGGLFILGNGFTGGNIIGGGMSGAGTGLNTVLLGDNNSNFTCKLIFAGGLSTKQPSEGTGNVVPPIPPDFTYSELTNVKIVSSKSNAFAPTAGSALYQLVQDSSSRKYKSNINSLDKNFIEGFNNLRPVSYTRGGNFEYGLIAEEVAEINEFKPFVGINNKGEIDSIEYDRMIVLAIAKIQQQDKIIQNLIQRIEKLEK